MSADRLLQDNLRHAIAAKEALLANPEERQRFALAAERVLAAYRQGGRLYIAGNGGSAADAQHLAAEFVSRFARDRAPLPAEALTVDSSILTAIGNDYGFEEVFARQVAGKMTAGDVFLGITTSGRSPNISRALLACRALGATSICFSGHDGGEVRALSDICILAPGATTAQIQEVHIVLAHTLCEYVEGALFPR
jgi:D-sedoheptulose 7-phosphate isomerase